MTRTLEQVTTGQAATPARVGQATVVEQSRAIAEVQAAIVVAQQCPRSIPAAIAAMSESCKQTALAERAFYRYPRAGSSITGPSVHLARELARCWGNVQYGINELRRDDEAGESEMQAFAWDVQTNTRSAMVFIVPHRRDTREGSVYLTDTRDVYENNANQGARRLREAIFSILPPWFTEQAKDTCSQTLADGGGQPLPQRIAEAIKVFGANGVTQDQLEGKLGRAASDWTEHDVAQLGVTFRSLQRGEVTRDEEFPPQRVTADELTGGAKHQPPASASEPALTEAQRKKVMALFSQIGWTDRDDRLRATSAIAGRPITTSSDLTKAEAVQLIDVLEQVAQHEDPPNRLGELLDAAAAAEAEAQA